MLLQKRSGDLVSLRDAVEQLMEGSFVQPSSLLGELTPRVPAVDMVEKGREIVVTATIPGLKAEDLEITITGDVLSIKGEVKQAVEKEQAGEYIYRERSYGTFCRSFTLPTEVDSEHAEAKFEDGILTLIMPKAESAKRKVVKIRAK
ncbi:MAG TPA: Hsp20/alpha crystallin family protein [Thermoflexia bacterium]|nr:Hsp20/alpha crystallin family protein [Thermoflexia bacterium]